MDDLGSRPENGGLKPFETLSLRPLVANPADLVDEEDEVPEKFGFSMHSMYFLSFSRQDPQR